MAATNNAQAKKVTDTTKAFEDLKHPEKALHTELASKKTALKDIKMSGNFINDYLDLKKLDEKLRATNVVDAESCLLQNDCPELTLASIRYCQRPVEQHMRLEPELFSGYIERCE